eukprot:3689999-Rhodomonas_salina.3
MPKPPTVTAESQSPAGGRPLSLRLPQPANRPSHRGPLCDPRDGPGRHANHSGWLDHFTFTVTA